MKKATTIPIPPDIRSAVTDITKNNRKIVKIVYGAALAVALCSLLGEKRIGMQWLEQEDYASMIVELHEEQSFRSMLNTMLKQVKDKAKASENARFVSVFEQDHYQHELMNESVIAVGYDDHHFIFSYHEPMNKQGMHVCMDYACRVIRALHDNMDITLKTLRVWSADEDRHYFDEWQGKTWLVPKDSFIAQFQQTTAIYKDNIAVYSYARSLTYGELETLADSLAQELWHQGVRQNDRVAVLCSQQVETIVAVVAVAQLGAVYVPIDVHSPKERCALILKESRCKCILQTDTFEIKEAGCPVVQVRKYDHLTAAVPIRLTGDLNSYLVYTSGTTGIPKGVMIKESFMLNLCHWYVEAFEITSSSRVILLNNFGFDASIKNIYGPLLIGASIVMGPPALYDTFTIAKTLEIFQVTHVNCVPALFYALLETVRYSNYQELDRLEYVILGGDVFDGRRIWNWARLDRVKAKFGNVYGPTECTSVSTFYTFSKKQLLSLDNIPIGTPIANKRAYVLDVLHKPCPPGMKGKLYLSGVGISEGYFNAPEHNPRFMADPFLDQAIMYDTGDIAYYDEEGLLYFAGREDHQIKIHGQRVEKEEVETVLKKYPHVKDAVVAIKGGRLIAFYTLLAGDEALDEDQLRIHMLHYLSASIVPYRFVLQADMELNINGKLDRMRLDQVEIIDCPTEPAAEKVAGDRGILVDKLVAAWKNSLEAEEVDLDHSFFEQGGTSLLLFKLKQEIEREAGVVVEMVDILNYPTIRKMSDWLHRVNSLETAVPKRKVIMRKPPGGAAR